MDFQRIWILRGGSIWARSPVFEVELDLTGLAAVTEDRLAACTARLRAAMPSLAHRPIGPDRPGLLRDLMLELQRLAGSSVQIGLVRSGGRHGFFRVIIEYEEEELGRACLETARQIILAALADRPFDIAAELSRLRDLANDVRLGPSTAAIVHAARRRGIPVRRLYSGSLVQLGHGSRQRRICTAETDATSAIAEMIAQDKQLTRALLSAVGVPVPEGRPVADADDAWSAVQEIGVPVVVKPQYGNHGRGVATNLSTREQVVHAYAAAREEGSSILVESYIPGDDYRLLVIGGRLIAAARREPAHVIGDGRSTITQLVAEVNRDPRRSDGHSTVLSFIKLDAVGLAVLSEQGYTQDSVPPTGKRVLIRRNGNLSTGGTATDVTDRVHPETAARAVEAARAVGLDIAGVDVVVVDIGRPLEEQRGAVVEVNAGPGLRMHLEPSAGQSRPVGEAIVDMLFTEGQTGRIPLLAVTGVNGKTTTTRLLAHLLRRPDCLVGFACTDGLYIGERRIDTRDCSGPRSARALLGNPGVDVAVVETARGGILREGLGFDRCHVGVVSNIGDGDHLTLRGIDTLEELARVKRVVVESVAPDGVAVLNAADPLVAAMAAHCPGRVIFFARDAEHPIVTAHRARGQRAIFVRGSEIILAEGQHEEVLTALERVPLTHGGQVGFQVENVLAACAAVWSLALPLDTLRAGLASFAGDARQVPGRFNVFRAGKATVIVDYAHNPSALTALVASLDSFPHRRRCLVFTPSNRRDEDVTAMGRTIGDGFDRVLLYRDEGNRDRADGELNALLRRGIAAGERHPVVTETRGELAAIEAALDDLQPGDVLVLGVEAIEEALAFVEKRLSALAPQANVAP
ncbi:MAG TPA: cyanophycin synthetase [Gemmataceae bacterium]|nr:cyanophycin synthetase [Gemmataceae bacterium]